MMDWTDSACRVFHRTLSAQALLYTEMVTSAALVRGGAMHLLRHEPCEHPVALQLGGSDPVELSRAARMAEEAGFDEINLNVGCPSDRVQSGCFGAVLMTWPALVADCVAAMRAAVRVPVTVKCRVGVDDQDPETVLPDFLERMRAAGAAHVIVHARKAWLQGLSPKENRDVPPLDYDLVRRMRGAFPDLGLSINGGIGSIDEVEGFLAEGFDGVMVGRAAYHRPFDILAQADARIWGKHRVTTREAAARAMLPYIERHLTAGGRLHQVTRHMLGLFAGRPGARRWRQMLSDQATRPGAGPELVEAALGAVATAEPAAAGPQAVQEV